MELGIGLIIILVVSFWIAHILAPRSDSYYKDDRRKKDRGF